MRTPFKKVAIAILCSSTLLLPSCKKQESTVSLSPAAALKAGWEYFRLADWQLALSRFEEAQRTAPAGSAEHEQALYALGQLHVLRRPGQDEARGKGYFEELLRKYPNGEYAPWAMLAIVRFHYLGNTDQAIDFRAAIEGYEELIRRFPESLAAKEAQAHIPAAKLAMLNKDLIPSIIADAEVILRDNKEHPFQAMLYSLIGGAYARDGQPEKSFNAALTAMEVRPLDPKNPKLDKSSEYWTNAVRSEFDVGDFDIARTYYKRLIDEYPNDMRVWSAKLALKRLDMIEQKLRKQIATEGGRE